MNEDNKRSNYFKSSNQDTDDEDDCEMYFLESVGETVNVLDKIAEANKKLFEDLYEDHVENENRPKKVQFSEDLVNFEPDYDFVDSEVENLSISDPEIFEKIPERIAKNDKEMTTENHKTKDEELTKIMDSTEALNKKKGDIENVGDVIEVINVDEKNDESFVVDSKIDTKKKLSKHFILLSQENSSCKSVIGKIFENEILELESDDQSLKTETITKIKIARPKSAGSLKNKSMCDSLKVSQDLNYTSVKLAENKQWQGSKTSLRKSFAKVDRNKMKNLMNAATKHGTTLRKLKKTNDGEPGGETLKITRCEYRAKGVYVQGGKMFSNLGQKTKPIKRTCCVIALDLPHYNGLRSEYGLSAEQLQERKLGSLQIKHQKMQQKLRDKQDEEMRRHQNDEIFQKWLLNKNNKNASKKTRKGVDTLSRSDIYIQSHASYAVNSNVTYCINYKKLKKINKAPKSANEKRQFAKISMENMLHSISPCFQKSFNIYLERN